MSIYRIADFIVECTPKYDRLKRLMKTFRIDNEKPQFSIDVTDKVISKQAELLPISATKSDAEELCTSTSFNRQIINYGGIFLHSSAILYESKAYVFAADSKVGKSTHTKLWIDAFGKSKVKYINDDKPILRIIDNKVYVYGTPFDGGSEIISNIKAPLGAIVFLNRGEKNSIRKATIDETISLLYKFSIRNLDNEYATKMLENFDELIKLADFYLLECNQNIDAAVIARNGIINKS